MKRPIRIEGDFAVVPLTQGYEATIDVSDVSLVSDYRWYASVCRRRDGTVRAVYAARGAWVGDAKTKKTYMHRVICGTDGGLETDHINGNGLDNRRSNLRPATRSQNAVNQSHHINSGTGVLGVSWHRVSGKWRAQITANGGRRQHLGLFDAIDDAYAAYSKARAELHGEFGRTS